MGPRADFSCAHCSKKSERPFIIENLPVKCLRCPICNHKRGFVRLFNAVNVIGGNGRTVGKIIDQTLIPSLDKQAAQKQGAENWNKASQEAMERAYHVANPKQREQIANQGSYKPSVMPAAAALSTISPESKQASRDLNYHALTNRTVKPLWHQ